MKLFLLCLLGSCYLPLFAQSVSRDQLMKGKAWYGPTDTLLVKEMLKLAERCLRKPGERVADLDSATVLVGNAMKAAKVIGYPSGLLAARDLELDVAGEARNPNILIARWNEADLVYRCYLAKNICWIYLGIGDRRNADTLLFYAKQMQEFARKAGLPDVVNEAEYFLARGQLLAGELGKAKEHVLHLANYHRTRNDPGNELFTWITMAGFLPPEDTVYPSRIYISEQIVKLARRLGRKEELSGWLYLQGKEWMRRGRVEEAHSVLREANDKFVPSGWARRPQVLDLLSKVHLIKANADSALYYATAALDTSLVIDKDRTVHNYLRGRLADVHMAFGRGQSAYDAIAAITGNNPDYKGNDWFYILAQSLLVRKSKGPAAAIDYLTGKLAASPITDPVAKLQYDFAIAKFYLSNNNPEMARRHYLMVVPPPVPLGDDYINLLLDAYTGLAIISMRERKWEEAQGYLARTDSLPQGKIPINGRITLARMYFQLDTARGNYYAALQHHIRYKRLSDSAYDLEKGRQAEELNIQYATERQKRMLAERGREIAWLNDRALLREALFEKTQLAAKQQIDIQQQSIEAAISRAKQQGDSLKHTRDTYGLLNKEWLLQKKLLAQTQHTRDLVVVGGVLLTLLLALSYNRYRLKRRINRQLEHQRDVIAQKNRSLEKLVHEKDWLLKEVHHRVKNNLQVVMSLLNTQSFYLQDDAAISAIRDSQRRVNAISLIHQKLYQSENAGVVDMRAYIQELVAYLREYSEEQQVHFVMDVAPVVLNISQALPIGLILNEAVTNAFKYAFNGPGVITITLVEEDEHLVLTIADNGKGFEEKGSEESTLGMSLMTGLVNDIDGTLQMENKGGAVITVRFPADVVVAPGI
ncbi:sensor histidine kinase [Chitinophaga horti]|uniref:histidine kinase n=1 Tax=Chitinophaga horti TaxID=2920382 RepID=A0ABY6J8M1_9BACT|nr:sensor histidine kinase [Chitinophaga horti]UYQ95952.1 sensor histidine kinase [Chitinophaga horti]